VDIENISIYYPTLENSMFQYCDAKSLTIGGSTGQDPENDTGGSAIYIANHFKTGMCSANCETFGKHP